MLSKDIAWIAIVSLLGLKVMSGMALAAEVGSHDGSRAAASAAITQVL